MQFLWVAREALSLPALSRSCWMVGPHTIHGSTASQQTPDTRLLEMAIVREHQAGEHPIEGRNLVCRHRVAEV